MEIEMSVDKGIVKALDDWIKYLADSLNFPMAKHFTKSLYCYLNIADGETSGDPVH